MEEGGGGFPQAIGLIILVVGTIAMVYLVGNETLLAKEAGKYGLCYSSIIESYFSTEETTTKCPITHYKVFSKKIEESLGDSGTESDSKIVKDFSATDVKINELFAKLMGNCLQTGGGLNSKAFSRAWLKPLDSKTTVCLECSTVEFEREIKQQYFQGLREYMEKTTAPNSDKKYLDILSEDEKNKNAWLDYGFANNLIPNEYSYKMSRDEIYGVFFVGVKETTVSGVIKRSGWTEREDNYFVYTAPLDKLNSFCDRKVN